MVISKKQLLDALFNVQNIQVVGNVNVNDEQKAVGVWIGVAINRICAAADAVLAASPPVYSAGECRNGVIQDTNSTEAPSFVLDAKAESKNNGAVDDSSADVPTLTGVSAISSDILIGNTTLDLAVAAEVVIQDFKDISAMINLDVSSEVHMGNPNVDFPVISDSIRHGDIFKDVKKIATPEKNAVALINNLATPAVIHILNPTTVDLAVVSDEIPIAAIDIHALGSAEIPSVVPFSLENDFIEDEIDAAIPVASSENLVASAEIPSAVPTFSKTTVNLDSEMNQRADDFINYIKPMRRWRLYPFKGDVALPTVFIHRLSHFQIGRDSDRCDVLLVHPSCCDQHAIIQFRVAGYAKADGTRSQRVRPYLLDMESRCGTYVNKVPIAANMYVELKENDVLRFGDEDEWLDDDVGGPSWQIDGTPVNVPVTVTADSQKLLQKLEMLYKKTHPEMV